MDLAAERLTRLRRLIKMRREYADVLNDRGLFLVEWCLFATYRDCVELGVGFVARAALRSPKETVCERTG